MRQGQRPSGAGGSVNAATVSSSNPCGSAQKHFHTEKVSKRLHRSAGYGHIAHSFLVTSPTNCRSRSKAVISMGATISGRARAVSGTTRTSNQGFHETDSQAAGFYLPGPEHDRVAGLDGEGEADPR